MIHPSYSELIDAINKNNEEAEENVLNSRYSLVLATSKRARQLIDGSRPLVSNAREKKPLSIAIDELYKGKVSILTSEEMEARKKLAMETDMVSGFSDPAEMDESTELVEELDSDSFGPDAEAVSEELEEEAAASDESSVDE